MYTEITQKQLEEFKSKPSTVLLDVRETWEYNDFNIGGINIPPHEITDRLSEIEGYENIIVACSNGTRSSIVARLLTKKLPETTIYHLEEGIF